ncbi:MAG: hypothetical protein AAGA56_22675, partial [Myxococcota bacterium]
MRMRTGIGRASKAMLVGLALVASSCSGLDPGEWGTFRYVGNVFGEAPLPMIPPVTNRDGDVFVAFGDRNEPRNPVFFFGGRGGEWDPCTFNA